MKMLVLCRQITEIDDSSNIFCGLALELPVLPKQSI